MSFQSQLVGATTSVLGAKEQQDALKETENKRQLENQYQSELDALREQEANDQKMFKTIEEQTVYKGKIIHPVRDEDGKLKGFVNIKTPAPAEEQKFPELADRDLIKERYENHKEFMTKQGELKSKLKELNELPIDKSIRRGILMSRLYNNYDNNNNKDQDNSNNIMEQQIRNSTEYINAQAALEQQRLIRRRRNGNNQSN